MSSNPKLEMACSVCGTRSQHEGIDASSCSYGPRDLDTRPPLPLRTALANLVLVCPSCGYAARNLMESDANVKPVLESPEYRAQMNDESLPPLANRFLCAALIADAREQLVYAGWSRVHAAWACDDKDDDVAAGRCRELALATFRQAQESGLSAIEGGPGESLLLADLLRRAGRFEDAAAEIAKGLAEDPPEMLANIYRLEAELVEAKDAGAHTVPPVAPAAE